MQEYRTVQEVVEDDQAFPIQDNDQFNKVKKLSKRDIGGGNHYDEPSIDQLFARRQKVHMAEDLLVEESLVTEPNRHDTVQANKPTHVPIGTQPTNSGEIGLSSGSGSGEPFQGYAV